MANQDMCLKKARVMEAGNPVLIRPRSAERLVFEIDERVIRMPRGLQ